MTRRLLQLLISTLVVVLAACSGIDNSGNALNAETAGRAITQAATKDAQVTQEMRFTASDGIGLKVKVGGRGALIPRPLIVEFSPYDPGCCAEYAGPDYNYVQVHIRGTGDSDGSFDALGPRSQQDVVEVMSWVCQQPWSNGTAGLYGFSASAIIIYNSLHQKLPSCVKAAVLMAGTHELYRDLLYPGGIPLIAAGTFVMFGIGLPAFSEMPNRLQRKPQDSVVTTMAGILGVAPLYLQHATLDDWWRERGMRGDVNQLPTLMITSFYDVEPRGPFQAFQELRKNTVHLLVVGAHDGAPKGTESLRGDEQTKWYDRFVKGIANNVESEPKVQMLLSNGDRLAYLAGDVVPYNSSDWPVPGTQWTALSLDAATSDSGARSINNGSLSLSPAAASTTQNYLELASLPTASDPHTTAVIGGSGANALFQAMPQLVDLSLVEPMSLSYTTAPLKRDVLSAGPANLELQLSSTSPQSDLYALLSDIYPDGSSHIVAQGRLRSSYPDVDATRSLKDANGSIVQPYGIYSTQSMATPLMSRRYQVEFWPIGNRFRTGHRLRLNLVGVAAYNIPGVPGLNSVTVGGAQGSRLLFPVLPESDLVSALSPGG